MSLYIGLGDPMACMGPEFIDSDKHPDNIEAAKKAKAEAAKASKGKAGRTSGRSMSSSWETIDTLQAPKVKAEAPIVYIPKPNESLYDILRNIFRMHTAG